VTSDSFAGMRALLVPSDRRRPLGGGYRRRRIAPFGVETAGRWSRTHGKPPVAEDQVAEAIAWQLLRRYGVVFRRLVQRETLLAPWRDILRVYRRLEARGEIRGGRFVGGVSGEQYALPEAIGLLRSTRREQAVDELIAVSGADPLNLVGVIAPGAKVPALLSNRVLYRDGVAVATLVAGEIQWLETLEPAEARAAESALVRRQVGSPLLAYLK
jgi:ATP-dependent Lhr-like helicase